MQGEKKDTMRAWVTIAVFVLLTLIVVFTTGFGQSDNGTVQLLEKKIQLEVEKK